MVPTAWEWYHRCLSAIGRVGYFAPGQWEKVSGFSAVLVHEAIENESPARAVEMLAGLRERNASVIWIEPLPRTTFAAPVLEPGFFEVVDRVAKFQLMKYEALLAGLGSPHNNLAPWSLYGHSSLADFYSDPKLFAIPTSRETLAAHLSCDLAGRYGEQIVPMMALFSLPQHRSWYNGPPSRQPGILKEAQVGIPPGDWPSAAIRGMVAGVLGQLGLETKLYPSTVRAAATSEACVALGPIHLDACAADVLRFDTLAILPEDERYLIWDDVYIPRETYLPLTGFGELIRDGGRVLDGAAARRIGTQLAADLQDAALRDHILEGQRRAHALLTDPQFVAAKLGIEGKVITGLKRPRLRSTQPATAPVQIGGIASDQISVVIQGTVGGGELAEQVVEAAQVHLPGAEIILSTWEGQRELGAPVDRRVESVDPGAPWLIQEDWPNNTNRLLVSTQAGLAAATRPYTLKLRTDALLRGTDFLMTFQRYPDRSAALRLLRSRLVVINYYCWNPNSRPFGLFSVADTVQFGRSDDVRRVWSRPLDDEPALTTWFETHGRPQPDLWPHAAFRYTPEQLLWVGFLRQHIEVPFEHFSNLNPTAGLLAEASIANNVTILDPDEFGVEIPTFAGREALDDDALYTHSMWLELYERYCQSGPNEALDALLAELALPGAAATQLEARTGEHRLERLHELATVARDQAGRNRAARARDRAAAADPLEGARPFVVLVDVEELLAEETLLRAYADAMNGSQLVTLAIDASRMAIDTAEHDLLSLVGRCDLLDREDLDLRALIGAQDPDQRRRMLKAIRAIYARQERGPSHLPVFTPATLDQLRELSEASVTARSR